MPRSLRAALRAVPWVLGFAPWIVCAGLAGFAMRLPPPPPAFPVLREAPTVRPPEPPKPKGIRYEPWEHVPS